MCGIAGFVSTEKIDNAEQRVAAMVQSLARRGPDGAGVENWHRAALGHRRLSIFDLSEAGRQPMTSPDGIVGVVFNGAIYNFRELRVELEARGYSFRSNTDTEVLIHGYRAWGLDKLVARLRGMFAFGLWDDSSGQLFLVRDRLGVKPLVYAVRDGQLAFASTVRALRAGGFVEEIDEQSVAEYLEFGFVTDARTIYRGAAKVPAASIVEWSNGTTRAREYWSPPEPREASASTLSFEEAVAETERLLLQAVERRLYADVPVGALLSGGVDSSLICWAIAELGGDIRAFTIGTPNDPWDETADARNTARKLGIAHEVLNLSPEDAPDANELVTAYAEPFACASALGMLRVSRCVAKAATVLLTGDGGDDVFLGYPEHRHFQLAEKVARALPNMAAGGWAALRAGLPKTGALRRASSFIDYTTGGLGAVASIHDGLPFYRRHDMLGERMAGLTTAQRMIPKSIESGRRLLSEFLIYDRQMRFVGEYMTKVDGATMHYAVEARSPFLDQELWEHAAALPFDVRLKGGQLKAVLRELARRKIGEAVASGSKRGFGVPVQRWLVGRWRPAFEDAMRDSLAAREGWINARSTLTQLAAAGKAGWAPKQLWYIFVLESWLRHEQETQNSVNQRYGEKKLVGAAPQAYIS